MLTSLSCHDALEIVQAPENKPVTLDEVKDHLNVADSVDNAKITRLINVAIAYIDVKGALGQAMITQKWAQWINSKPPQSVDLILEPVQGVTDVKYYDTDGDLQTDTLANYEVFGTAFQTKIKPKQGFSWPVAQDRQDAIKIEYKIGFGADIEDIPDNIRHAIMVLIGHWHTNAEQTQMDELSNIPYGFEELLNIHRNSWYG